VSTPFDAEYGTRQGRIEPTDGPAFQGAFVYQLGHDLPGQLREFAANDVHVIDQSATFTTGARTLRLKARVRPPTSMPAGTRWIVFVQIDGTTHSWIQILAGDIERTYADLAASISTGNLGGGSHDVELTLLFAGGSGITVAELPSVALDELIEDQAVSSPGLFNRNPEPGATAVPLASNIEFVLYDSEGGTLDSSRTTVYLDGAVIATGGGPVGGWTIGSAPPGAPNPPRAGYGILIPPAPFAPNTTYTVRVQAALSGGPSNALDTSWSFTTLDTTPPTVVSAMALDPSTVAVVFNKFVIESSATGSHDALNPANYTITLMSGAPAVTPTVTSVTPGAAPSTAVLTLGDPLTAGAVYLVTVAAGVEDTIGNLLATAPHNAAQFVWAGCPQPAGRDADLWRLLPQGARTLDDQGTGDLRKFISCLQVIHDELLCDVDAWSQILDPDTAPEPWLDAMLADLGNPFTTFMIDVAQKRQLVRLLPIIFGLKGTDPGMIDVIQLFVGVTVQIVCPAWQGTWMLDVSLLGLGTILGSSDPHDLYTFDVISPVALDASQVAAIGSICAYMRPAWTHLGGVFHDGLLQPQPPAGSPPTQWTLGVSLLGTTQSVLG
jgi:phage tail-like protein